MKKTFNKIDGVNQATISFMTQKLIIDADEARFEEIMEQVVKACKKVESGCEIVR